MLRQDFELTSSMASFRWQTLTNPNFRKPVSFPGMPTLDY